MIRRFILILMMVMYIPCYGCVVAVDDHDHEHEHEGHEHEGHGHEHEEHERGGRY